MLIQVGPPDDEHLLFETCRGVEINTLRKSASSWSLTRIRTEVCRCLHSDHRKNHNDVSKRKLPVTSEHY